MDFKNNNLGWHKEEKNTINELYGVKEGYIYGKNFITKHKSKQDLKINVIGDSIGYGSGSTSYKGFINCLNESFYVDNFMRGIQVINPTKFITSGTFKALTQQGLGGSLGKLEGTSSSIQVFATNQANIPTYGYKVKIVYSKRTDGGDFALYQGSTLLNTFSCNGDYEDGITTDWIDIAKTNNVIIKPTSSSPCYINHIMISHSTYDMCLINYSIPGYSVSNYSNIDEIIKTSEFNSPDVLIWELGNNDYLSTSTDSMDKYKEYAEATISNAKSNNIEVIIITCCQSEECITDESKLGKFNEWHDFNIELAKKYKCCHIDYNELFGGYDNASINGLLSDNIHPNNLGYMFMADILCDIFDINNYYSRDICLNYSDTRMPVYNKVQINQYIHCQNMLSARLMKIRTVSNTGSESYTKMYPTTRVTDSTKLPKYAPYGSLTTVNNGLYVNENDCGDLFNKNSLWKALILPSGNTRPTENLMIGCIMFDTTLGKPIWYKGDGIWVDAAGTEV